jgi:hypothetical protein
VDVAVHLVSGFGEQLCAVVQDFVGVFHMRKLFFGDYLFFGTAGGYQQVKERLSVIDRCKGLEK